MRWFALLLCLLVLGCGAKKEEVAAVPACAQAAAAPDDTTLRPLAQSPAPAAGAPVSFGRDILPVFFEQCVKCHSPEKRCGNYELNSWCGAVAGGADSLANVLPRSPDSSRLYEYLIKEHPAGQRPDSARAALVRTWIKQGAPNN